MKDVFITVLVKGNEKGDEWKGEKMNKIQREQQQQKKEEKFYDEETS